MDATTAIRLPARPLGAVQAGVAGTVSAAVALGAGELVAGLASRFQSPVEAVAGEVIDRVPLSLERFAIETFGHNDKLALVIGMVVSTLLLGAVLGLASRRRRWVGVVGLVGFASLGVASSLARPTATLASAVPGVVAGVAGLAIFMTLFPTTRPAGAEPATTRRRPIPVITRGGVADRRIFLAVVAAAAGGATLAAVGGRSLRNRFGAAQSRAQVRLRRPTRPLPALPSGVEVGVAAVAPFVTSNSDFYRVDTALVVPQVRAEDWTLDISGLVDRPYRLTYEELSGRDLIVADITMTCVSNPVGGDLVGHARWLGVLARDLLDEAGVRGSADQLVGRSVDGYTCGFPLTAAYDRNCLVAVGMNGEPLPLSHGFPVRLVTPGIYGYVGSTKWLTELEVTTFDAFEQYWARRGYAAEAPVKTMARIDTPRSLDRMAPGRVWVAGVAWAQTRGIDGVEIRIDDDAFVATELAEAANDDSWRQWRYGWDATPGRHTLTVRAVDGTGETQTERRSDVVPDGASGWMSLVVLVEGQ